MRQLQCIGWLAGVMCMTTPLSGADPSPQQLREQAAAVLSQIEGEIPLAGLREPVEVRRDKWGIAHIYAQNQDDLFFAQGFVAAQDRLFQIDMWRRIAVGETAEIFGPKAIEADRFARLIRYRGEMQAEWTGYAPDAQAIATAFTRGINAYIDHAGERLPIEFQILGHKPKKWQPEDVLGRMSGIIMTSNWLREISRARLVAAVGVEKARAFAPTDPPRDFEPVAGLDLSLITQEIAQGYALATAPLKFQPNQSESNNWVIDGTLSASGKPLLASDPHRAIALPSLRYLVHLHAPGWNVIGAGEPALPGVALGHNERIAWGFTIVGTDQADLYVEETNPENPNQYRADDRWEPMRVVHESIAVKGRAEPVSLELRFTRHGPVIHQDESRHAAFALKWSGSEPGGAAYLGSLSVDRAGNRQEFLKALEAWKIPGLNFVYADVEGQVGWVAAALTPIRNGWDGLLPVPGAAGKFEWQGYLPVSELPQSWNPPAHWLATANHNILPPGYTHQISYEWSTPHRYERIRERLKAGQQFTLDDFRSIQHEATSLPARTLIGVLKSAKLPADLEPFRKLFTNWDGVLSIDSQAGPLYGVWLQELMTAFYADRLPKDATLDRGDLRSVSVLLAQLMAPTQAWFGAHPVSTRDELVRTTFAAAVERTKKLQGDDLQKWSWGKLHTASLEHPLASLGPAHAQAFNLDPVPRSGDGYTPNNTRHDDKFRQIHGASYRHVLDLADWDRGLATSTPGQSGQPESPHYGDLLPLWAKGEYFPLAYSRAKVEEVTAHTLKLKPSKN
jgi:penicillin amidase